VFHPQLIVCPTDFSENAVFALRIAQDLARQHRAALLILHVADTLGPEKLSFGEAAGQLQPEAHLANLTRQLHQIFPPQPDLEVRYLLREGDPATVIEQVVREHKGDLLVVLGTHGRTGLDYLLMGSTAQRIMRRCPCPVLIVKYPLTASGPPA
jgi:nucleotide-binding universal stress UspA family protein